MREVAVCGGGRVRRWPCSGCDRVPEVAVPFDGVLVANRGEIALRIFRTLRRLGLRAIAVHSDADASTRHVREADAAFRLDAAGGIGAYLSVEAVVDAATRSGAGAVHPGYGFLSENASFARAVDAAGLAWVGPPPEAIEAMGDKIRAKATVGASGVPTVPGGGQPGMSDDELVDTAVAVGLPVLLKPSAGGGGKGMHRVAAGSSTDDLRSAIATARREAVASFGDGNLLVERWIERPRHLEIQILADTHGSVLHLGERECSLQRRHQKVVEEAPSPLLAGDAGLRSRMGAAAVDAARAAGYVGAGTVEFVVAGDHPADFYFMEMNTRLQVEHPVTEAVTGIDLVEWQLRVAAGQALAMTRRDVGWSGHAVEARIYAEDPARGFLPTGGPVLAWRPPRQPDVRVDDGIATGDTVSSDFDPMLAKVIAWAPDRPAALSRLGQALEQTTLLGLTSNVAMLRRLVAHPDVVAGRLDTGLIERESDALAAGPEGPGGPDAVPAHVAVAAACLRRHQEWSGSAAHDPWSQPTGWRPGGPAWVPWRLRAARGATVEVWIRAGRHASGPADPVEVVVTAADGGPGGPGSGGPGAGGGGPEGPAVGGPEGPAIGVRVARSILAGDDLLVDYDGEHRRYAWARAAGRIWLGWRGQAWSFEDAPPPPARPDAAADAGTGPLRSPMPGTVRAVRVAVGDDVTEGQVVVTVEAMKMEYAVAAAGAGRVTEVLAREGQPVALDQVLIELGPENAGS